MLAMVILQLASLTLNNQNISNLYCVVNYVLCKAIVSSLSYSIGNTQLLTVALVL